MVEYCTSFLNGLELDTFFQKYQIILEMQRAQHRFHSISQRVKKVCKNFRIFSAKYKNSGNLFFQPENMTRIKKYLTVNLKFFKIYRKSVWNHKILPV